MAVQPTGIYKVRRPFDADGKRMEAGSLVDVTNWRNAWQLIDRGYLVVSDVTEQPKPPKKAAVKKTAVKKQTAKKPSQSDE